MGVIAVAMSGGVDSSLAALLLHQAGHQVVGLSLRLGAGADRGWQAGAQAAAQMGLPHQVVEAAGPFERQVLEPVAEAYATGLTPNPCAWCNARVKLPLLWRAAQKHGCQALATGHYARVREVDGVPLLAEASHRAKSQAYFLARVGPELLPCLRFPLGELDKEQVRQKAAQAGLKAAGEPESQDACFLPPGGWDQFMASRRAPRPGTMQDAGGRVLGHHQGLHQFTVGQRRGLGLALGEPVYVTALDGERAVVRVGPKPELATRGLVGSRARWYAEPEDGETISVRFRYSHAGVPCWVRRQGEMVEARFEREQGAVAPGQLAVFFRGEAILGSAWIDKSIPNERVGSP
ncbi:MAG: tRNA 2-thiouridine(34) synthase MnmA [Desulfarculaceae bacterium]|nr:tRNA 2-thiouridine(34) synthase MnmA [Desulfarculaceae bacterium]MCF8073340.1 tRNA 2-thiouridine(34) synthase MnmA [Desulfarculaceae bacterium]MCF8103224.1 tRNA 2-thiouridine(34) synthase MnmA [Desulfarculaceae bacterium]MCF8116608.1 tRNA 2-thiouridine(34) synthase MnmA [Desulfarculaceae bacterium]